MKRYQLTLDEHQASVLAAALDLYMRIGLGQFAEVVDVHDAECRSSPEARERARALLDGVGNEFGFSMGVGHGIHSLKIADRFRVAFDLKQVVRHRLAWDRDPEPGIFRGVDHDKPYRTSAEVPLATIAAVRDEGVK